MKSTEEMKEKIIEVLENLADEDIIIMWNEYMYPYMNDEHVFEMSKILEIIEMVQDGRFDICDDYFAFDDYGNLISFNDISDKIDLYAIADYAINMGEDFCNDEIEKILNEDDRGRIMTRFERINEILENMDTDELLAVHNKYCQVNNYTDDEIFDMYMIDVILGSGSASEILSQISDGSFNSHDDYFHMTIYGAESFNYPRDYIYIKDIARYIDRTENSFGNSDIAEILDEYKDESEEE